MGISSGPSIFQKAGRADASPASRRDNRHAVDAVIVTDWAGVSRAMNVDAAKLLNVAVRVGQTREASS